MGPQPAGYMPRKLLYFGVNSTQTISVSCSFAHLFAPFGDELSIRKNIQEFNGESKARPFNGTNSTHREKLSVASFWQLLTNYVEIPAQGMFPSQAIVEFTT